MTKLSKDEFITKINDKLGDNEELKVELMEDITDSFNEDKSELKEMESKFEDMKSKYEDLQAKYKERFMNPSEVREVEVKNPYSEEEKDVIDIREI
ncbi:MAG: hypothetical protein J6W64_02720 [Bacilli bacterium]|jgi:flagellar capping protein FliD|nr:hypothetical protein [Bacilli bacterium]